MIINLIFTILAAVIGVFELALFAIICSCKGNVKKPAGVFIIGAVVCAVYCGVSRRRDCSRNKFLRSSF